MLTLALAQQVKSTYEALLSYKSVKDSCFGNVCDPDYLQHIKDFGAKYLKLNIGIPLKIHCILVYVPQFLAVKVERVLVYGQNKPLSQYTMTFPTFGLVEVIKGHYVIVTMSQSSSDVL